MSPGERLILYVAQRIADEEAYPSRTKLLKIIYLIDVEYFRRHRQTLTGWDWVYYHYGPFVFDFPKMLERLSFEGLTETEDIVGAGRTIFRYSVSEDQSIDDLVSFADRTGIDCIIKQWALQDLNLLLNHVYFETPPMRIAQRGKRLDFGVIPRASIVPPVDWADVALEGEHLTALRKKLADFAKGAEEDRQRTSEFVTRRPFLADESYIEAMNALRRSAEREMPDGATVSAAGRDDANA